MSYAPDELLELFRKEVDDLDTSDPLWTDTECYAYMDDAQKEFARLTDCFADTGTTPITADDAWVVINPRYTRIRGARLASTGRKVFPVRYDEVEQAFLEDDYGLQSLSANWEALTGTPRYLVTDMISDKGRLVGIPADDDTLNLVIFRLPLTDIEDDGSEFEVTDLRHQRAFIHWMKKRAYEKHDTQTLNTKLSRDSELQFRSYAEEAKHQYRRLRMKAGTIRYGGL